MSRSAFIAYVNMTVVWQLIFIYFSLIYSPETIAHQNELFDRILRKVFFCETSQKLYLNFLPPHHV